MFSATLLTWNTHLGERYHLLQTHTPAPPWRQLRRSPTSWRAEDGLVPTKGHLRAHNTSRQNPAPDEGNLQQGGEKPLMNSTHGNIPLLLQHQS